MLTPEYLERFSNAIVEVINAERGRRNMSFRALAGALDLNVQYLTYRIGNGNPKTGNRTPISVSDLELFGEFFAIDPADMLQRAREEAMDPRNDRWTPTAISSVLAYSDDDQADEDDLRAVARATDPENDEEQ